VCALIRKVVAVVPSYLPASFLNVAKTTCIMEYFKQGFKYIGILGFFTA
jgi:hypothetical protein